MAVFTKHPDFNRDEPLYLRLRHVYEGEDAVKKEGEKYLPKLSGDTPEEYESFKLRANFFPALTRTVNGLVGGVFRVDPVFSFPVEDWSKDITTTGIDVVSLSKLLTLEVCLQAKVGVLIDYSAEEGRPMVTVYPAECIVNWGKDWVVVKEKMFREDANDPFSTSQYFRWRHIYKNPQGGGAVVDTYDMFNGEDASVSPVRTFIEDPGEKLGFPFVIIRPVGDAWTNARPPLLGLANVNLACYRNSADLENGRHLTSIPTPWVADDEIKAEIKSDPSIKIKLGSKAAFILQKGGRAGFMEYTGQGLGALERAIEEKKNEMASLGAMMILQQRKQVESSETARIHASAQTSLLSDIVTAVERGMVKILELILAIAGRTGEVKFNLNRNFVEVAMDPTELVALVQTWQAGGITHEVLAWNIKRSGMIPPDMDVDKMIEEAAKELDERQKKAAENAPKPNPVVGAPDGMVTDPNKAGAADRRKMDKNQHPPKPTIDSPSGKG